MATKNAPAKPEPEKSSALETMSPRIVEMVTTIQGQLVEQDSWEASLSIIDRILSSEDEDAVFAGFGSLTHARDELIGVPIEVLPPLRWNVSDFQNDNALGFYAVFDYVDLRNMTKKTGSVGSLNCMAQLYALEKLGKLPKELALDRVTRPTKSGYLPLFFRPVSEADMERIADGEIVDGTEEPF